MLAEPVEIAAVVAGARAETDQEPGEVAVALGDAEVFRGVVEASEAGRIQRQDRRTGGVVEGKDGIQLVLAHVADDDRHWGHPGLQQARRAHRGGRKPDYRMPPRGRGAMTSGNLATGPSSLRSSR